MKLEWFNLAVCAMPLFLAGLVCSFYLMDKIAGRLGIGEDDGETM